MSGAYNYIGFTIHFLFKPLGTGEMSIRGIVAKWKYPH